MNVKARPRYVAGVSWPRSGHHLLQRLLMDYFEGFGYCNFYDAPGCCGQLPCARPDIHFTKSHDPESSVAPVAGVPYLVQYRTLVPSLLSGFELYLRNGEEDSAHSFEQYALHSFVVWAEFLAKWVDDIPPGHERLLLSYEDLTDHPRLAMERVIPYFDAAKPIDYDHLDRVLSGAALQVVTKDTENWTAGVGVKNVRKVEDFRYYNPELFDRITQRADEVRKVLASGRIAARSSQDHS